MASIYLRVSVAVLAVGLFCVNLYRLRTEPRLGYVGRRPVILWIVLGMLGVWWAYAPEDLAHLYGRR